jgi:hypothetical protein
MADKVLHGLARMLYKAHIAEKEAIARYDAAVEEERKMTAHERFDGLAEANREAVMAKYDLHDMLDEYVKKVFESTGNTNPVPGVTIKTVPYVRYDYDEARSWAFMHNQFLEFDASKMTEYAKRYGTNNLPFANLREWPVVSIDFEELGRFVERGENGNR